MQKMKTVYLPVKVEDELPESECFNINFHNQLHCGYVSENKRNGGYKSEDDNTTSNHLIYWLKPQEAFVFTPEQLNELLSNVIKNALDTAAETQKETCICNQESCVCSDKSNYIMRSITNTFDITFQKYKV